MERPVRKLPSSGYTSADDSKQPGYLASKFRRIRAEQKALAEEKALKVKPLSKKVA